MAWVSNVKIRPSQNHNMSRNFKDLYAKLFYVT